jgi:hypothetical protein
VVQQGNPFGMGGLGGYSPPGRVVVQQVACSLLSGGGTRQNPGFPDWLAGLARTPFW